MNLRLCVQALLLLWLSLTAVCGAPLMLPPDGKGLEEGNMRYLVQPRASRTGPGPWQGGRRKFRRQRPVSPIRAPCLSESGLKGSPRPAWCCSPYSTNSFSSLEPSHPFGSRLAPVIAANGPGSFHPPSSSNGVVLPLICMIQFLSQGSNWPISLATPWTAIGDPASPRPSSSPYQLVLAFLAPSLFPLSWKMDRSTPFFDGFLHSFKAHSCFLIHWTSHIGVQRCAMRHFG